MWVKNALVPLNPVSDYSNVNMDNSFVIVASYF